MFRNRYKFLLYPLPGGGGEEEKKKPEEEKAAEGDPPVPEPEKGSGESDPPAAESEEKKPEENGAAEGAGVDMEALAEIVKEKVMAAMKPAEPPPPDPIAVAEASGDFETLAKLERERRTGLELSVGTDAACAEAGLPELAEAFKNADLSSVEGRKAFVTAVTGLITQKADAEAAKRLATDEPVDSSAEGESDTLTDDDIDNMSLNDYAEKRKAGLI